MEYIVTFSPLTITRWQDFHNNPVAIIKNVPQQDSPVSTGSHSNVSRIIALYALSEKTTSLQLLSISNTMMFVKLLYRKISSKNKFKSHKPFYCPPNN